jgi:hypothetical protein
MYILVLIRHTPTAKVTPEPSHVPPTGHLKHAGVEGGPPANGSTEYVPAWQWVHAPGLAPVDSAPAASTVRTYPGGHTSLAKEIEMAADCIVAAVSAFVPAK